MYNKQYKWLTTLMIALASVYCFAEPSAPPTGVSLASVSDSGISESDQLTKYTNLAADALAFQVDGVAVGAQVRVFADGVFIGSGTAAANPAVIIMSGTIKLEDGTHHIIATQQESGKEESLSSPVNVVEIDTSHPYQKTAGEPVLTFGTNGKRSVGTTSHSIETVYVQKDGKILVAGSVNDTVSQAYAARYHSDGSVDSSFGAAGSVTVATEAPAVIHDISVYADGTIYLGGNSQTADGGDLLIVCIDSDGQLNDSFGDAGVLQVDVDNEENMLTNLVVTAHGDVFASGTSGNPGKPVVLKRNKWVLS